MTTEVSVFGKIAGRQFTGVLLETITRGLRAISRRVDRLLTSTAVDARRALLQEAISEAAGGGTHVETDFPLRADAKSSSAPSSLKPPRLAYFCRRL